MAKNSAYCSCEIKGVDITYTVYDRHGRVFVHTTSSAVAQQYLKMAQQGLTARLLYWLERWRWRVPREYLDRD